MLTGTPPQHSAVFRQIPAALILGVACAIALVVFWSVHTYHLDDWNYLGYIAEIDGIEPNLNDPFMGTDEDVQSRLAYNLSTWAYYGISELLNEDPVYVFHSLIPPFLIVGSVLAVFFMLRAAAFGSANAAVGSLVWLLYFLASASGGRSSGTFFFDRIAQDKALAWLLLSPIQAGLALMLVREARDAGGRWSRQLDRLFLNAINAARNAWLPTSGFALATTAATLVHPLGALFGGAFVGATLLRNAWTRGSWPSPNLVFLQGLALIPAFIAGLLLRVAAPTEAAGAFRTNGPTIGLSGIRLEDFGLAHIVEIGPTFVADPAFIALLNFPAMLWVLMGLHIGRRTVALTFGAAIYVVTAISFVPPFPALLAPLITTIAIWRLTWLMALACTLVGTDFCQWLSTVPSFKTRGLALAFGALTVGGACFLFFLNYDTLRSFEGRGAPSEETRSIMTGLERVLPDHPEPTVLADEILSLYIPAYTSDISVVGYPRLDTLESLRMDGRTRRRATEAVAAAIETRGVRREMQFWGADFLVLSNNNLLYYQSTIGDFQTCYADLEFKVLALRRGGECPPGTGELRP